MTKIEQILKDSAYKLTQFNSDEISAVEEKIYQKPNGKFYIKCLIREREIQLKPEEIIRQLFIYKLLNTYGYKKSQIEVERAIHFGREVKRADIAVMEKDRPTVEYIIVEVKRPNLKDGKEQLKSYCHATGATMGVWTNGDKISYYHRKDPNYFEDIPNIPQAAQKLKDILTERWTIQDLVAKDKLSTENKSLKDLILEMEDEVLANAGVDVFEEVFKLIYIKLYDEKMSAINKTRFLEFRNYGETDAELKDTIQNIFDKAKTKWAGVFVKEDKIKLTPSHLAICISSLQNVKLFNSNLEVIDEAFEYLMSKSQKGEKGQYFTPRYVIDMCVKMLNPKENEFMIDTAAGSCGFPVHTIFHVWKNFGNSELFTAEDKPPQFAEYVQEKIFAIDFDEKAVRVARTLNLIAGDGKTNVLWLNTLDYERWDEYLNDEDWQDIYFEGWLKLRKLLQDRKSNRDFNFDIVMANPPFAGDIKESRVLHKYDLARKPNGTYQTKMSRDVLFIERNLQFLKPGGRMAIVLPQGRFNNSSDKYIRDFIAERCRILAVVGLHGNVFKPHTGTKTSVLFVQKWDDTLCPRQDDYKIFFATMQKPSKDNSGEKIYVATAEGLLRDKHNHLIVDHDLFNHDALTQDGIAEAFIEFAKKERLSFFDSSSFNEQLYNRLLEGLECTEILLSEIDLGDRFDSDYFTKNYLQISKILSRTNTKKLGELVTTVASAFYPAATDLYSSGDVAFVRCVDCINYPIITYEQNERFEKIPQWFIDENDGVSTIKTEEIVITKVGSPCFASIVTDYDEVALSRTVLGLTKIKNIDPYYLMIFLRCKYGFEQLYRQRELTIQFQLTLARVKNIDIFIPTDDFQNLIRRCCFKYLEALTQSRKLYSSAEKILAQELHLEDFKPSTENTAEVSFASFMQAGRLDAEYFMPKYDDIENKLAEFPQIKIKDLVKYPVCSGSTPKAGDKEFYTDENNGVPFIRAVDIVQSRVDTKNFIYIKQEVHNKILKRTKLQKNDVLFSIAGTVGRCGIFDYDFEANINQAISILRFSEEKIKPLYLVQFFNSDIGKLYIERYSRQGVQTNLNLDEVSNLSVPILPMATQNEIAALVEKSFALRAESKRLLEEAKLAVEMAIERGEIAATEYLRRGGNIGD